MRDTRAIILGSLHARRLRSEHELARDFGRVPSETEALDQRGRSPSSTSSVGGFGSSGTHVNDILKASAMPDELSV